jgi:hypothetical protein
LLAKVHYPRLKREGTKAKAGVYTIVQDKTSITVASYCIDPTKPY